MKGLKFKKGDFITQKNCANSFAIFGGDRYDPIKKGDEFDYSLICYSNPLHFTLNNNGEWEKENVFEYDLDDDKTCEYTINESDMNYWRLCTETEIDNALVILSKNGLAWVKETNKLRKLNIGERVVVGKEGANSSSSYDDSSVRHIGHSGPKGFNPYYCGSTNESNEPKRKLITISVNEEWEQKEPISTMSVERKVLVSSQCEKLKYAFNSYRCGNVTVYPQSGAQVPRKADCFNGYGMCAYNALMQGTDWWGYCE